MTICETVHYYNDDFSLPEFSLVLQEDIAYSI